MQFCCSLSGASAPRDPTYSTVQEQQTGFLSRYDDVHVFYVCMHNSQQKKSSRILLQHVKLDRYPASPPLKFPRHNGQKINKSEMQVSTLEADSDPAAGDLFINVLNVLTCPLDQKLRASKMHTKVGARS